MPEDEPSPLPPFLRDSTVVKFAAELGRIKDEQRMLVLVTSGFLELLVNTLIDEYCKNAKKITGNNRDFPFSTKLILLHEMGKLSDGSFGNINWLRKVRNRAAHDLFFEITKDELNQLKSVYRDSTTLHNTCLMLWGTFWNEHVELFARKFMPGAFDPENSPKNGE